MRKRMKSNVNPVAHLKAIRDGFSEERKGHRDRLIGLMVSAFQVFQRLKTDSQRVTAFYKEAAVKLKGRSKPTNLLKEVMAYIADANNESAQKLASKRARVLEFLDERGVPVEKMSSKIRKYGGIEKTYRRATRKTPRRNGLGHSRFLIPVEEEMTIARDKSAKREKPPKAQDVGRNDNYADLKACASFSVIDELREMGVGAELVLRGRRIDKNDALLRITSIGDSDW